MLSQTRWSSRVGVFCIYFFDLMAQARLIVSAWNICRGTVYVNRSHLGIRMNCSITNQIGYILGMNDSWVASDGFQPAARRVENHADRRLSTCNEEIEDSEIDSVQHRQHDDLRNDMKNRNRNAGGLAYLWATRHLLSCWRQQQEQEEVEGEGKNTRKWLSINAHTWNDRRNSVTENHIA